MCINSSIRSVIAIGLLFCFVVGFWFVFFGGERGECVLLCFILFCFFFPMMNRNSLVPKWSDNQCLFFLVDIYLTKIQLMWTIDWTSVSLVDTSIQREHNDKAASCSSNWNSCSDKSLYILWSCCMIDTTQKIQHLVSQISREERWLHSNHQMTKTAVGMKRSCNKNSPPQFPQAHIQKCKLCFGLTNHPQCPYYKPLLHASISSV